MAATAVPGSLSLATTLLTLLPVGRNWLQAWARANGQLLPAYGKSGNGFRLLSLVLDSDNGSEFINYQLQRYCQAENISFTRSRPYHKNDNAHVEQKNWEAIRKIVGYDRLDTLKQLTVLNELYSGSLRLYLNYFQPTRKRKMKTIDTATGKQTKRYFEAKTPYRRVMEHPTTSQAAKDLLTSQYNQLNPVQLLAKIQRVIDRLRRTFR